MVVPYKNVSHAILFAAINFLYDFYPFSHNFATVSLQIHNKCGGYHGHSSLLHNDKKHIFAAEKLAEKIKSAVICFC